MTLSSTQMKRRVRRLHTSVFSAVVFSEAALIMDSGIKMSSPTFKSPFSLSGLGAIKQCVSTFNQHLSSYMYTQSFLLIEKMKSFFFLTPLALGRNCRSTWRLMTSLLKLGHVSKSSGLFRFHTVCSQQE